MFVYLDDTPVGSATADDHAFHLRTVFERMARVRLATKCQFGTPTIDYLGYQIRREGVIPLPAIKADAIRTFERPTAVKGLQKFAGIVNFYYRSVLNAARIMRHIYAALAGNHFNLEWSCDIEATFNPAKQALSWAKMFVHPHAKIPTALTSDP